MSVIPEGVHPVTKRDLIEFAVLRHYQKNLKQVGDRRAAAKLVVLDMILDLKLPPERHRAHAQLVSQVIEKHEAEVFTTMMADELEEDDGR